jgi:hypothetical protein
MIGHLSVFYSTLDFFVELLILGLVASGKSTKAGVTLGQKVTFLQKLDPSDTVDPALFGEFSKSLPQLKVLADKRNRLLHDQWSFSQENLRRGVVALMRIDLESENLAEMLKSADYDLSYFQTLLSEVGDAQKAVMATVEKLGGIRLSNGQGHLEFKAKSTGPL